MRQMSDGVVIDANVIPVFYQEYLCGSGPVFDVVAWISTNIGIAINDHIAAEWENTCSADLFMAWYADQLKLGTIRKIVCGGISRSIVRKMIDRYGFPARSRDIHYIRCAYYTHPTKYIVTYNYDFYEPTCQQGTIQARARARELRHGRFCNFLSRELGISVGMPQHCKADFGIP
jgi:hypothetical protein